MNKKSQKYINQYQERNYAPKERKLEKSDLIKYCNRGESRETSETGCSNSLQQSRESKEEKIKGDYNESSREEEIVETYQQGRQGISFSDKGRQETEETNTFKTQGEIMKKQTAKEKKHEAKETKAYERKEDKKEKKAKKK